MSDIENIVGQKTPEWYRARCGKITSSMVYNIMLESKAEKDYAKAMTSGMKKGETMTEYDERMRALKEEAEQSPFSDTARTYLYKVAAERMLRDSVISDDLRFCAYLERVSVSTRDMRYGVENEDLARIMYVRHAMERGCEMTTAGFYTHPTIPRYGDSPDGIVIRCEDFTPVGCIEIKCPTPGTYMRYMREMTVLMKSGIHASEALKDVKPEYYWQCQSHMACSGVEWCDFIVFDKMIETGMQVYRIERNEADIEHMTRRLSVAEDFIRSCMGHGYRIDDVDEYDQCVH